MDLLKEFFKVQESGTRDELATFMLKNQEALFRHLKDLKVYRYMVTFTVNPSLVDPTNEGMQQKIEDYIIKQVNKHSHEAYIAKEHATTNCHWHVVLLRHKKFKYNEFNYYKKSYGNIDISLSKTESIEDGIKYISKETVPKRIK